jgi:hypothetical protein
LGEYLKTRGTVLEEIQQDETKSAEEKMTKIPKRPKIPMPQRRTQSFQLNSRPTRFDRRINRMLRKIWSKEHQVPVVEESLRD